MTGSVNDQLLEDHLPTGIMIEGAAVGSPTGYPAVLKRRSQVGVRVCPKLRDDLIAVVRVHRFVVIPMEDDRRDRARNCSSRGGPAGPVPRPRLALAHCRKCRGNV